jgi:hypothetical protein
VKRPVDTPFDEGEESLHGVRVHVPLDVLAEFVLDYVVLLEPATVDFPTNGGRSTWDYAANSKLTGDR